MKILTKLTLAFLFVSLLPLTGTSIFSYWNTRQALTQKILNQLDSVATIQEHRLEDLIDQNLEKLALTSSRVLLRQGLESLLRDANRGALTQQVSSHSLTLRDRGRMNETLLQAKASISDFKEISVLTPAGKVVASTDTSTIGTNHSSEDFFIKGKKENTIGDFYFDRNRNLRVHLSGPIYSGRRLLGVTLVDLDPNNLTSLVKDYSGLGETGETTLAQRTKSGDGITISPLRFNPHAALRVPVPKGSLKRPMTQALLKREGLLPNSVNYRGKPVLAVSRYLPKVDWGLTVIIDQAEAFAPIYDLQNSLLLTIITSSTGVTLISIYVARSLTRPVISLTQAVSKISSGDLLQRVGVTSNDETGTLARSFNQMADSLLKARTGLEQQVEARTAELRQEITERKKAEVELRESKLFAESITEHSTSIIYVLDLDTMTNVYSNHSVAQLLGYSLEQTQAMGKDFLPNVIHPDDLLDRLYRFEQFKYARDDEVIEFEQRVKHASGKWRWIWSREVVFKRRPNGTPYQIIGTAQDINERKQTEVELKRVRARLEEQVAERTAKLQRAVTVLRLKVTEHRQAEREIRLLQEIARAVSESSDFHAALGVAVDKVCKVTGWNYGEAWIPRSNDTALECSPIWYGNGDSLEQFRQFSEQLTFAPGIGLPGRVWLSREPEWIQDVSVQPESIFLRNGVALAAGLKAGLSIPVIAGERVLAVLTFFLFKSHRQDERLVRVISAIATQLGSVMQRKQAESALQNSEGRYRALVTSSVQIIWTNNAEGKMVGQQPGWAAFTGQTYEQYQDYGWSEAIHAGDREHTLQQWYKAVERRGLFEVQHRVRRHDGEYRHFAVRAVPVLESSGSIREWVGTHTDITEAKHLEEGRKQAEELLEASERQLRMVTDHTPVLIAYCDTERRYRFVNKGYAERFGLTREAVIGKYIPEVVGQEAYDNFRQQVDSALSGQAVEFEVEIPYQEIGQHYMHVAYVPEFGPQGEVQGLVAAISDITQRKQTEEALRESEERYRLLCELLPLAVWMTLPDGSNIYCNQWWFNYTGLTMEQTAADGWASVLHPDDHQQSLEAWKHAVAQDRDYELEYRLRRASDGTYRWHIARGLPLRDADGQTVKWLSIAVDIHQRKQAEAELNESAKRFRFLADSMPQGIWTARPDGWTDYHNQRFYDYTGMTPEQVHGWDWGSVVHPDDLQNCLNLWTQAITSGEPYTIEQRVKRASDGMYRWHLNRALPRRDETGAIVQWVGTITDIHDQKESEAQLRTFQVELEARVQARTEELADINQRLQAILDNIGDGVIVVNKQGDFLLFNPAAEEVLGTRSTTKTPERLSEEYGLYLPDMVTPYPVEELPLTLAIRGVVADEIEVFSRSQQRPTGVWLSASARPLKDASGEAMGGIAVFHDVTERKRAEENLRTYAAKLEKANKELEQFNYVAAHDLKTPLRTISIRIDLLARQLAPLSQSAQHQLSRITLATLQMDSLLNDLVAYSRVGARVNPPSPTNSQAIVEQVLHQQLRQPIQESGAIVEVESLLPIVLADATQFAQVWQHLISNSLKFCSTTPQIKISATCSLTECTFCIADNGIGIPNEAQQRIFGVFKRLHNQETYKGTGIGLSVVQRILDWHGGRIWVESEDGKGSKFFFTLRRADLTKD